MLCDKNHRYDSRFENLPEDQGGIGRHVCAGCAYEKGFEHGEKMLEDIHIGLGELPESQAGTVRHRSPHAAYAMGYLEGVKKYYKSS